MRLPVAVPPPPLRRDVRGHPERGAPARGRERSHADHLNPTSPPPSLTPAAGARTCGYARTRVMTRSQLAPRCGTVPRSWTRGRKGSPRRTAGRESTTVDRATPHQKGPAQSIRRPSAMSSVSVTAAIAAGKRLLAHYEAGETITYDALRELDDQTEGLGWLAIRNFLEEVPGRLPPCELSRSRAEVRSPGASPRRFQCAGGRSVASAARGSRNPGQCVRRGQQPVGAGCKPARRRSRNPATPGEPVADPSTPSGRY